MFTSSSTQRNNLRKQVVFDKQVCSYVTLKCYLHYEGTTPLTI